MKIKAWILSAALILSALGAAGCSENSGNNTSKSENAVDSSAETVVSAEKSKEEKSDESSEELSEQSKDNPEQSKDNSEQSGTPVDSSWFDDAVFIGDSVTLKLSYYAEDGDLGDTTFLCSGSLGYNNCLWDIDHEDNVHPVYNGEKLTVFDGAELIKPKKIFIMFGMNDIALYGIDDTITAMREVTEKLLEKCPDAVIYVESVTPTIAGADRGDLNNVNIREFDEKLKSVCEERGYKYLDVYSAVADENGDLIYEYCGDPNTEDNPNGMGLHFTNEGCKVWADYLKTHVA